LAELFSELMTEIRKLMKQEVALLRTELAEKLKRFARDAAALGAGGVVLHTAFLALVATIILGIATFMPLWLAALLMTIVLAIAGVALVQKGRKDLQQMQLVPEKSSESMKETVRWVKSEAKAVK
jgi:nitrate/nitrite transporter NarK